VIVVYKITQSLPPQEDTIDADELRARTRAFALRVIKMAQALPKNSVADVLGRQVLRSATSVGANYRAACRARTGPNFLHKLSIVVEEADETVYWLELIRDAGLVSPRRLASLTDEAEQILKIMSASLKTAQRRKRTRSPTRLIAQSLNPPITQ
jgi:four helix bundle protein